jgi:putative restriction endonuclease
MTWHESVISAIQRVTTRKKTRIFSRQDLIETELGQILAETKPGTGTPEQTLNRVLQELRTTGLLESEAPDIYRLVK